MDEADTFEAGDAGSQQLKNETPQFISDTFSSIILFLQSYGWFLMFGIIFGMVVWTNISGHLKKFFGYRKRSYDVTDSLTPEQIEARMEGMERARRQMQERYDELVRQQAEKRREREEDKRTQKINDHDALMSGKSQSSTKEKIEKKVDTNPTPTVIRPNRNTAPLRRNDYSPLGGGGGSSRWRPSSNRPSAGG